MIIRTFPFDDDGCRKAGSRERGSNWPVVYLIYGSGCLYVGETSSFTNRFKQHLSNSEKKKILKNISLIDDVEFNKSAVLDIEQHLIRLCGADGKFELLNKNAGQSGTHDYFQRKKYEDKIPQIWDKMSRKGLTKQSYNDVINLNVFKYSPYIALTSEQNEVCYNVLKEILETLEKGRSGTSVIHGCVGTGKTIVGINIVYTLANISLMNADVDENSTDKWHTLIREWKEFAEKHKPKIGFVIPMQSLRATLSKVFKEVGGSEMKKMIISPYAVTKEKYDVLIVDESHRLKQRQSLSGGTEYAMFDSCCADLTVKPNQSNQLEWIIKQSRHRVLFYDSLQSIKPCDIPSDVFENIIKGTVCQNEYLTSQLRCLGGNDYIEYINDVFSGNITEKKKFGKYDIKVFNKIQDMIDEIQSLDKSKKLCRILAGFSWEWNSRKRNLKTIEIEGRKYIWNTTDKDWIISKNAINEIGCVHTTQGYDLNYVGVIFGREIEWDEEKNNFVIYPEKFFDKKVKEKSSPEKVKEHIINAYKVMMTRGIKGCYMYACNPGMKNFLKKWFE